MEIEDEKASESAPLPKMIDEALPAFSILPPPEPQLQRFDCPKAGCVGKIAINDDVCRFGYGAIAYCDEGHRFKWCSLLYSFVPAEEWHIHTAWCPKSQPNTSIPVCLTKNQPSTTDSEHGSTANNSNASNLAAMETSNQPDDTSNGMDVTTTSDENDSDSIIDGADSDLPPEIKSILSSNREYILKGDGSSACMQWMELLREHRSRTLVAENWVKATQHSSGENQDRGPALMAAVMKGDAIFAGILIREGADANTTDASGNTALHWAAVAGIVDVGRVLLDGGADVSRRGAGGDTPLHVAAAHGRMGFFELLVAHGADLDSLNAGDFPTVCMLDINDGYSARQLVNLVSEYGVS